MWKELLQTARKKFKLYYTAPTFYLSLTLLFVTLKEGALLPFSKDEGCLVLLLKLYPVSLTKKDVAGINIKQPAEQEKHIIWEDGFECYEVSA